jgi:hypothetical protein
LHSHVFARLALSVAFCALASGCAGGGANAPAPAGVAGAAHAQRPQPLASGRPWMRAGIGVPKRSRIVRHQSTVLVSETFANPTVPVRSWFNKFDACLTAGTADRSIHPIPACGSNAPQDPPGGGALELTPAAGNAIGSVGWRLPLPTANGLDVQFTLYAFDGTIPGADGSSLYFTDGSFKHPAKPGGLGGALGYLPGPHARQGLNSAYLGVGFDEFGNFSSFLTGGPGFIPETVALGGAQSAGFPYLGGVENGSDEPASLPFDLDDPSATTRQSNAPTIDVSLTPDGLVEVAIDIHDGNGSLTYVSQQIVGVNGQPAVPATVFVGFAAGTGGSYNRHQIGNLTISTLQ